MGIAFLIAFLVVMTMVSDPAEQRTLDRHATENPEQGSDWAGRLERSMREKAMEADRNSQAGQGVHDQHHGEMRPAEQAAPTKPSRSDGANKRADHETKGRKTNRQRNFGGLVLVWGSRGNVRCCVWKV